jgi:glucose-6-phosphate isomerase
MPNIYSNFYNIDFQKDINLPEDNITLLSKINNEINNAPSLNIVKNSKLLEETTQETLKFSHDKESFVIFGTGGSNLGAKALINLKQGKEKKKIIFCDNIDPIKFKNIIDKIDIVKTGFIIISKSGSTPETLSQFGSLIELCDQKNISKIFFKNSLIITEDKNSPLFAISNAHQCKILIHEANIGGRYSVFSNVGMVPSIIAGLNVKLIHDGALDIISKGDDYSQYFKIAQYFRFQRMNPNLSNNIIFTYSDALYNFGKWYLQLWAESIGKNGRGITPIHAIGTTDQHSQLQLYLDGPRDKFFNFITTDHVGKGLKIHNKTMINYDIKYLNNKTMGDLMQAEQQATIDTFKLNNFSMREICIPVIDEFSMGQIMASSIIETIATCIYFGANPFDQPAVEQGKKLTKKYLI